MTPTEFAVKTLYWFFLYGFIGWGVVVVYAAIKTQVRRQKLYLALLNAGSRKAAVTKLNGTITRRKRVLFTSIYQEHRGSCLHGTPVWQDERRRTSGES